MELKTAGDLPPFATSGADAFLGELAPGDLLLFDSSYRASALIKFADNSPVNHCAIFVGGSDIVDVTHREAGGPAVQRSSLLKRLEKGHDYSVTALRHISVPRDSRKGADRVAGRAIAFCRRDTLYNYRNLLSLTLPAFLRAYFPNLDPSSRRAAGLETLANAFIGVVDDGPDDRESDQVQATDQWGTLGVPQVDWGTLGEVEDDSGTLGDGEDPVAPQLHLTCSEFAYRCFTDLEPRYDVDVKQPLGRYQVASPQDRRPRSGDEPMEQGEGDVQQETGIDIAFHPVFASPEDNVPATSSLADSRASRGEPSLKRELAWEAIKVMKAMALDRRRREHDAWPPEHDEVVAPLVTPRDLWTSPSFEDPCSARGVRPPRTAPTFVCSLKSQETSGPARSEMTEVEGMSLPRVTHEYRLSISQDRVASEVRKCPGTTWTGRVEEQAGGFPVPRRVLADFDDQLGRGATRELEDRALALGQRLAAAVFKGKVATQYHDCKQRAEDAGGLLRVFVCIEDDVLKPLPWEALLDPETQEPIAKTVRFVRSLEPEAFRREPRVVPLPLSILGVVGGNAKLDVDDERDRLQSALGDNATISWVEGPSWTGVHDGLSSTGPVHVLHFIGHGRGESLSLIRRDGSTCTTSPPVASSS